MCWLWCFGGRRKKRNSQPSAPIHLLLKGEREAKDHVFCEKKLRKARRCQRCHEMVRMRCSKCRVCKFVCHTDCRLIIATKAVTCVPERAVTVDEEPKKQEEKKQEEVIEPEVNKSLSMELAYVTERIIALWFPSLENDTKETKEETHEKILDEATSMLRIKHGENCMVFDLSTLDESNSIQEHTMTSHYLGWLGATLAPPLERLCSACKYIESWLSSNPQHVAVLFARGPCSKERIGIIISAYLTYSGICGSEEQALDRFAMRRFFQDKIGHLTSPSSVRYVGHFSGLLSGGIRMNAEPLYLKYITICGTPTFERKSRTNSQSNTLCFFLKIYQQGLTHVYTSPVYELSPSSEELTIGVENTRTYPTSSPLHLRGDVLLKGYRLCRDVHCRQKRLCNGHSLHRHSLFQCQFHTCAVAKSSLCFPRAELDNGEDTEVKYPADDGNLELHFYNRKDVSENSPLRFSTGASSLSSALYLPYADEDEEQTVANSIIAHDSMEDLCSRRRTSYSNNIESTESWANEVLDEDHGERGPEHLTGPLDGSLYATVSKGHASMEVRSPRFETSFRSAGSEVSRSEALESPPPSHEQNLDELLGDMLMTVENIPDLRPSDDEDIPYHARKNGRPFTYGAVPERKQREEMHAELSSPGLVRKASRTISPAEETSPTSDGYSNLTWLQLQQQKLRDRREGKTRQERHPQEFRLLKELRTYQRSSSSTSDAQALLAGEKARRREDGYVSDTSLPIGGHYLQDYNGSTEDHWERGHGKVGESLTLPLRINTSEKNMWSEPGSPLITRRSVSREKTSRYGLGSAQTTKWQEENTLRTIGSGVVMQPTHSEDGERPFVAVKRAHEYAAGQRSKDSVSSMDDGMAAISQSRDDSFSSWATTSMTWGEEDDAEEEMEDETDHRKGKNRPQTPAFPVHPRTPYSNGSATPLGYVDQSSFSELHGKASLPPKSPQATRKDRSQAAVFPDFQGTQSLRPLANGTNHKQTPVQPSTLPRQSHGEHHEVSPAHVKFVRDTSRFWYKPTISREEAIAILKDKAPGTFIVRDSNSFPGAFGLALKVATPPANVPSRISSSSTSNMDISNELVRHFLIEPTSRGVKLKGCVNEPVFSSLSALVYQHSLTAMALPCQLILPESDPTLTRGGSATDGTLSSNQILLQQGAACNVLYLLSVDTESLTGPQAVRRAISDLFSRNPIPPPTVVHFKVSGQGITLTDNKRRLFFRRHYPVNGISHCGLDPDDHRWTQKGEEYASSISSNRCFGFVARKPSTKGDNQCHIFAELDPGQPATAIVNFVTRVMMAGTVGKTSNIV